MGRSKKLQRSIHQVANLASIAVISTAYTQPKPEMRITTPARKVNFSHESLLGPGVNVGACCNSRILCTPFSSHDWYFAEGQKCEECLHSPEATMTTRSCGSRRTLFTAGSGETSCPFMLAGASLPRGWPPCPLNWLSPRERETANRQLTCYHFGNERRKREEFSTARHISKETEHLHMTPTLQSPTVVVAVAGRRNE